ncbi:hypothetical protein SUBVAR_05832 [Subdoligranulum variabile DSM 15176]|uniref:Uncharacterized protein n=2 Tax=Subdoligranulum variabile TaxID=214851 RepID=D1PNB3_9FIRM|nr:hypothetical protein SUBVAR_05832 [Subdoligranulum variabile DSM 15176]
MAMGGIAEVVDREVDRVICNVLDPSTKATAKRKIVLTLTFNPDETRSRLDMDVQAKSTLAPVAPLKTDLCITKGRGGELLMAEMLPQVPGQIDMDGDEAPEPAMARVGRMTY